MQRFLAEHLVGYRTCWLERLMAGRLEVWRPSLAGFTAGAPGGWRVYQLEHLSHRCLADLPAGRLGKWRASWAECSGGEGTGRRDLWGQKLEEMHSWRARWSATFSIIVHTQRRLPVQAIWGEHLWAARRSEQSETPVPTPLRERSDPQGFLIAGIKLERFEDVNSCAGGKGCLLRADLNLPPKNFRSCACMALRCISSSCIYQVDGIG